jgi:apoptosis-inducing factor 3
MSYQVAGNHGRAIGKTIAGGGKQPLPFEKVPVFWSARMSFPLLPILA